MFAKLFDNRPSVLIVDDDISTRARLKARLANRDGYIVFEAENGMEALDLAEQHIPSLIVLDWKMPDLSGIQVLKQLRNQEKNAQTPVIMLTSKKLVSDVETAFDAGALEYISKPMDIDRISQKIAHYVGK